MALINKPDISKIWASTGSKVAPLDAKIATGWIQEMMPAEWENFLQNRTDVMLNHISQRGIPEWDAVTEYQAGRSYVTSSSGTVYRAVTTNTNISPSSDSGTNWVKAFVTTSDIFVSSGGNLGIGTSAPGAQLHLVRAGGTRVMFSDTNGTVAIGSKEAPGSSDLTIDTALNVERVRVTGAGNVGVGTATPGAKLHSYALSGAAYQFAATSANKGFRIIVNDTTTLLQGVDNTLSTSYQPISLNGSTVKIGTPSAEELQVVPGSVLIGATAPASGEKFRVVTNTGNAYMARLENTSAATPFGLVITYQGLSPNNTSNEYLYLTDTTGLRLAVRSNGGIANYQANNANLSDERTKKDFKAAPSYYDKFKAIEFVTFMYKDQTDSERNLGVKAQQLETLCPELIDTAGFGETPADGVPLKAVYQTDFQYATARALQEAILKIDELQAEIQQLKAKL
jgi:hypothetical protein